MIRFPYDARIVESIKKIPRRKFNSEKKYWGVPLSSQKEVLEFAEEYQFFIDLGNGKHYDNNHHLVGFSRLKDTKSRLKNIPLGIQFCEGRKAKIPHKKHKCDFWWCVNQECFKNSTINHLTENFEQNIEGDLKIWEYYTLLDFLKILDINVDEVNHMGDFIPNGHYYNLLGHINAFNRLLKKMYCNECDELLYPTQTSHFALYRNVNFHCENEKCKKKHKPIVYLNHCLNGECSNIIDSRTSHRCENGLYVCDSCGTCCSTKMFERRLENLKLNGGYIHANLIHNVENKAGHLEKKEYYCHKCKGMMTEHSDTYYKCESCEVSYDLSLYKYIDKKWTQKFARRKDYPIIS